MERFSKWRDAGTGVAPLVTPLPATSNAAPFALKAVALPLSWLLAGLRTGIVGILLLLQWALVEVLFSVCFVIPPLRDFLGRIVTSVLARVVLLLLGYFWIPVEKVSLKRTARSPPALAFAPGRGDLIIANSSSYIEVLYLAFHCNPTFLLPVSSTGSKASSSSPAKITSWRRVGLLSMMRATGSLPERSERGETLEAAYKAARGPLVFFPECTTSNNRALLRFGELLETHHSAKALPLKTFILSFKHDLPTPITPSATLPIPTSFPLSLFTLTTSPAPRTLLVRRLHPSESPKISAFPKPAEMEALAEALAGTGRWKRTKLDWEDKQAFLEFRAKRK